MAIAVWGPRERNPWLGRVMDVASAQFGKPVPPPGVPGVFSLGAPEHFARLLRDEFPSAKVTELSVPLRASSFDEWWDRTCALAGPLTQLLAAAPTEARRTLRERAREAAREYETADVLEFPGVALLATASR